MGGTKLCSRHLPQDIIYCVGGVSVFFPLFTQFFDAASDIEKCCHTSVVNDKLVAEVIELVATVLDGNVSNQQQMYLLSGLSILGFLLQSATPQLLTTKTLSALKYMFDILRNCSMSKVLLKDGISQIYLNPQIWVYASYEVQRDLYIFVINYFETDGRLLPLLCGLPWVIDIVCRYYWEKADSRHVVASKPLFHSVTKQVIGERPEVVEIRKLRLLLLSLAEMSLKIKVSPDDIRALVAFIERSQDIACISDVLDMIIRALSQGEVFSSFVGNVNYLGGCCIFINLLKREFEPVRLLGLQLLGKLLTGIPSEKKETKLFALPLGQSRPISENLTKEITAAPQFFLNTMSERLFKFPLSDNLCAALFSVLSGTSAQQVPQENSEPDPSRDRNCNILSLPPFSLPQILICIFRFMHSCKDSSARTRILNLLLGLLDSNSSNIEALMEHSWNSWLETSTKLEVFKDYKSVSKGDPDDVKADEISLVRNLYSLVLSYYLRFVRGGWHQLDDTANYFLLKTDQGQLSCSDLLRDILDDIAGSLLHKSVEDNIFLLQPCCDNVLHFLNLIQELLISQMGIRLLFLSPSISEESSHDNIWKEDIKSTVNDILNTESHGQFTRFSDVNEVSDDWWSFFDKVWSIIRHLNGKGPSKFIPKDPNVEVASLGQRARGLVESMNVPAAEKVAVVSGGGGIGTALGIKVNRFAEKATTSREEIIPRIFFHLVILYLCKAGLENASKCVIQFMSLLPILLISEDDQSKNKLHFLIWSLLIVRSQYGQLDDSARFHVFSHLILETIIYGKSMLVTNILERDDSVDVNNKETGFILSFIQKNRVLAAAANEVKHMKAVQADRLKKLQDLRMKLNECSATEIKLAQAIEDEIHLTITAVLSADDNRKTAFQLAFREDQQIIRDKWIHISRALMDERGPWSANPFPNDVVTHWKLDKTEDRWRRRFKFKRNYKFDERLCQPSQSRNESTATLADQLYISAKITQKMKQFLVKGVRGITEDSSYEQFEDTNDASESSQSNPSESQNLNNAADTSDHHASAHYKKEPSSTNGDNDYTKVLCSVRCVFVTPKRKLAGQLDITRTVMHFSFEFLVEGTGGSSVFSKFKDKKDSDCKNELGSVDRLDGCRDSMIETNGVLMQNQSNKIKRHKRWNITKIKGVHWTRYLLQYTAMEIFFDDSTAPIFLNFSSQKDTKNAGTLLVSLRNEALFPKGSTKDKNNIISFVDRRVGLEMAENARERWKRREISNFEYLVILNTLAGRSYNDLTQYPIFPWVLADYTSEKLDFNKSSTFRDLSKPVGALDENRFKVFEDRYLSFCDPDIPSFYYGSHYSSMGIVLHYMLRLEPFTTLHLNFQGGKFDHADRLFQSIESAYINSLSNTSDVKELIPEFFYMPEFLENSNSYHLGVKQDGEPIGDVALPPWAKGSPEEFIHINREALESEYVSSNLHNWIDLIFGYKQRGQPAVEAANIFYYVTYEGAVDLENMDDMLHKSAIEDQIANFGQTPIQIFRTKHPRRGPPIPIAHPLYFAPQSLTLTSSVCSTASHMCAILFISLLENTVVLMNEGLILSVKLWLTAQLQSGGNFTYSGPQEHSFGIGSDVISPRKIGTFLAENVKFGRQFLATMQNSRDNYLILCGNWENSFQIISLSDGRIMQSIRQHKDVVSCVAVSSDGNVVATGSYDTTVMIWHAFRGRPIDKKIRGANFELSEKEQVIVERPVHILCGHDDIITCLFVSTELDIVISGSKDGTCIFHTLREGRYVRSIQHPSGVGLSKLVASQHGRVVLYSENDLSLHMYSINGRHIASSATLGRLNCIELSCSGDFIVCAGELGQIVLRSMHSLGIVWRYDGNGKTITSLAVTPEECILAGTKNGSLLVFSTETSLLRRGSMQRNKIKPSTSG
ncbi:BEACH domain-containing protein B [Zea mays]|uniref:BEACH domain-containing protein B n=1 Tax=Zea mays TaxID=4577 RepID=A0A3L6ECJ3_MAIZE|nr:BEACH domain-containing protein B [Zea mays]